MATIAENIQTLRSIKSDIKNAIIQKGGSVTDAFGTYAQAITDLPSGGGGGTENEDALITRTLSGTYYNNRVSMVAGYAFYNCRLITSVGLPLCLSVSTNAFGFCSTLQSIDLPLCEYIGNNVFYYCSALSFIDLPLCSYIGSSVFYFCEGLLCVKLPLCENIGSYTFQNCSSLKEVYLNSVSSVTNIQLKTFSKCPNLTSIYVPASLVNAFKTAQYWSSLSTKIVAYSEENPGFEVEEPGVGGVPDEGEEEGGGSL